MVSEQGLLIDAIAVDGVMRHADQLRFILDRPLHLRRCGCMHDLGRLASRWRA
jgi:hypothetical protein